MNLAWYLVACTIALIAGLGAAWMIWGPRRRPRHDQFAFESEPDGERATCLVCGRSTLAPTGAQANYWAGFHHACDGQDEFVDDARETARPRDRGSAI